MIIEATPTTAAERRLPRLQAASGKTAPGTLTEVVELCADCVPRTLEAGLELTERMRLPHAVV